MGRKDRRGRERNKREHEYEKESEKINGSETGGIIG